MRDIGREAPCDPPEGDEGSRTGCGDKAYGLCLEGVRVAEGSRTGYGWKPYGLRLEGVRGAAIRRTGGERVESKE